MLSVMCRWWIDTHTSAPCGRLASCVWTISFPSMSLEVHNMTFKVNTPSCLSLWTRLKNTMKHKELLITWKRAVHNRSNRLYPCWHATVWNKLTFQWCRLSFHKSTIAPEGRTYIDEMWCRYRLFTFKNRLSWTRKDMDLPEEADWID